MSVCKEACIRMHEEDVQGVIYLPLSIGVVPAAAYVTVIHFAGQPAAYVKLHFQYFLCLPAVSGLLPYCVNACFLPPNTQVLGLRPAAFGHVR